MQHSTYRPPRPDADRIAILRHRVALIDPDVVRAADEVDHSLLDWSLSLTLRERLRACTRSARTLDRLRRASSTRR